MNNKIADGHIVRYVSRKYEEWCGDRNEDYCYDEVHNFVDCCLTRGELLSLFEFLKTL